MSDGKIKLMRLGATIPGTDNTAAIFLETVSDGIDKYKKYRIITICDETGNIREWEFIKDIGELGNADKAKIMNFKNQKITVSNINNVTVEDMVTIFDGFVEEKVYIEMYSSTYNETVLCTKKELKYMLDKYNAWCKYKGIYSECNTVDEMIDEPYFDIVLYHYREII